GEVDRGSVVRELANRALRDRVFYLAGELLDARQAGSGDRLVGRDGETLEACLGVEYLQDGHGRHGGAVRVRDDALDRVLDRVRVNLADNEGNLVVAAPCTRVVDNRRARRNETRGVLLRGAATCR